MNLGILTLKYDDVISNKLLEYLEWEKSAFKGGPLLAIASHLTLAILAAPFAGVDCLCQTGAFTAKLLAIGASKTALLLTSGKHGKLAKEITFRELKEHATTAAFYFLTATASSVTGIAAIILIAAFGTQLVISVPLAIRVGTIALLAISAISAIWIHNPNRLVLHYRNHHLFVSKTLWRRVKEFAKAHKNDAIVALKAATPTCTAAAAFYLYRRYS